MNDNYANKTKHWLTGTDNVTIEYCEQSDCQIIITSDPNSLFKTRSTQIVVETTNGSVIQRTVTINQAAKQTYSGSANTPTPTVTLETHENNIMLRQIIKVINTWIKHHPQENANDFNMNVIANLVSSGLDFNKIFKR